MLAAALKMQRAAAALQTCIDHQLVALTILQQSLESQRGCGPDQPCPGADRTTHSHRQMGSHGEQPAVCYQQLNSQHRLHSSSQQAQLGSAHRPSNRRTILLIARESKLTRFVALTAELTSVEQDALCSLQEPHFFPVELKLSVELRNICIRLATRKDCFQFDGDLKEIEDCLMNIVNQLLLSLSLYNSESHLQATAMLKGFLKKFPDMRNHLESSFYCS